MRVLGLSAITDTCFPDCLKPVDIEDVLRGAALAEPKLKKIVLGVLSREPRVVYAFCAADALCFFLQHDCGCEAAKHGQ